MASNSLLNLNDFKLHLLNSSPRPNLQVKNSHKLKCCNLTETESRKMNENVNRQT